MREDRAESAEREGAEEGREEQIRRAEEDEPRVAHATQIHHDEDGENGEAERERPG